MERLTLPKNCQERRATGEQSDALLAGIDEVGRGALIGPVYAAAVVFTPLALPWLQAIGVKDSKQLTPKKRYQLAQEIKNQAISYQIATASVAEIDQYNIFQASLLAMFRAVRSLSIQPTLCLVDGNHQIPALSIPQQTWIRGDQHSPIIAAASILAKVERDEHMTALAVEFPQYDLAANKGYPTPKHKQALKQFGPSSEHRKTFRPVREAYEHSRIS